MSRKTLSFLTLSFLGLALIGCNRGCTTTHTIASESTIISTSGGNVEVVGRVVDYRNSQRRGDDVFDRSVTHTYGLCFDLKYGTYESKDFYHEGVKDPKAVDLPKELKRVEVMISKDQNHIGLGVDGKVVQLIHLYKSNRIATEDPKLVADGTMEWSKLDIESYPSPGTILTEGLKNSCGKMSFGNSAVTQYCDESKPSAKVHKIMLDKWPKCDLASDYLTQQKVEELSKDKKWKKYAIKRGKKVLKDIDKYSFEFDEVSNFITALNSSELNDEFDDLMVEKWGRKGMTDYTGILVKRIEQKKNPMDKAKRDQVYNRAKSEFEAFQKTGKSNHEKEAANCIQVLKSFGDTMAGHDFIQNSFGTSASRFDVFDFLEVAYGDFNVFTEYQQQQIIQKTEPTFASIKGYSRSSYFSAIDNLVDCAMLKRLKNKYPEDLKMYDVPIRCNP